MTTHIRCNRCGELYGSRPGIDTTCPNCGADNGPYDAETPHDDVD